MIDRRAFLRGATASAGLFFASACAPFRGAAPRGGEPGRYRFPQGVASGDPRPDSVVLWTRVEAPEVTAQLAIDPGFRHLVLEERLRVGASSDHTVRLVVDSLAPDTRYFYRFRAGADASPEGRTRTAPAPDAEREVRFAFASCQSYEDGFYGAYRRLVEDDRAAPPDEQLDFVLHLGDFIYEYAGGGVRQVPPFPSGGASARTLDDYRHLYRTYLSDPDLQAARARWPFVVTWDDHEFSNDGWQSHSTGSDGGTGAQRRKLAANRAWFEYVPAHLSGAPGVAGVPQAARDFAPVRVEDAPFGAEDAAVEPNNRAAIGSLTIYRSLRFGRHLEVVVTDTRSYRSDHAVPEETARAVAGTERGFLPVGLVRDFDAGSVLGAEQKAWWKATMAGSDATWKVWANSVPLMPLRLDASNLDPSADDLVLSADAWDGYPSERAELFEFLVRSGVRNFLSLAGDHHMHFAGLLMRDFDADALEPIGAEFAVAGISSTSLFRILAARGGRRFRDYVVDFDRTLREGMVASAAVAASGRPQAAEAHRNPRQNRHLRHVESQSNGYGVARVGAEAAWVSLVTTETPIEDRGAEGARVLRVARFSVKAGTPVDLLSDPGTSARGPRPARPSSPRSRGR